jgi:2-hydroxychromene-2-carboxylate isomerase
MKKIVSVYFDFVSPYSYLFHEKLFALIKSKPDVTFKTFPVLFAGLLNNHGTKGPAEIPAKREYVFIDSFRSARTLELPFRMPPTHPFNPLLPLRCVTAVEEISADCEKDQFRFARELLKSCWGMGQDISKEDVIIKVAQKCLLDGPKLVQLSSSPQIKEKLRRNTEQAIQAGVFGVPTAVIDGNIFWGSDRVDHLNCYLDGSFDSLNIAELKDQLNVLPRGADRRLFRREQEQKEKEKEK